MKKEIGYCKDCKYFHINDYGLEGYYEDFRCTSGKIHGYDGNAYCSDEISIENEEWPLEKITGIEINIGEEFGCIHFDERKEN